MYLNKMSTTKLENIASNPVSILVADDEPTFLEFISDALQNDGYDITKFDPSKSNKVILQKPFDVAFIDIRMPEMDGFEVREEIFKHSAPQIVFITGNPDPENVRKANELGVYSFLAKPALSSQIRCTTLGALHMRDLEQQNLNYKVQLGADDMGIVGSSPKIKSIRNQIINFAQMEIPVLITGETGTGKELVAEAVHKCSRRSSKPYVVLNCTTITPTLVESELFGHVQGAFTGATKTKHGFFEAADSGSIFIDELGDFPYHLQAKILRVLDNGEYNRVGETTPVKTNARIISATNKNLEEMITKGTFRQDLYYRLRGAQIKIPALRERKEDIPAIAQYFLKDESYVITPAAMEKLQSYDWPGNVRELQMTIKNLKGICPKKMITEKSVNNVLRYTTEISNACEEEINENILSFQEAKKDFEIHYFQSLLTISEGNISKASNLSGMDRKNLRTILKRLEIYDKPSIRG